MSQRPSLLAQRNPRIGTYVRYNGSVEWSWRWRVRIRAHSSRYDPFGTGGEEIRFVDTVAELRDLVLAARHDPRVMSLSYERERYLTGRPPTDCPQGHSLQGPS